MPIDNPFHGWSALTTSQLGLDTVVPRNTYIMGKTHGVASPTHPLKFCLKCEIPTALVAVSDYTSAPTRPSLPYKVFLHLHDPSVIGEEPYDVKVDRSIETYMNDIKRTIGKEVYVDVSGMRVVALPDGVQGGIVTLEGRGETIIKTAKGSLIKVFPNPSQDSFTDTPPWMNTPDPSPSPPPIRKPVPQGYQPITAHPLPIFSKRNVDRNKVTAQPARIDQHSPPFDHNLPVSKKPRTDDGPSFPRHNGFASRKTMLHVKDTVPQAANSSEPLMREAGQSADINKDAGSNDPPRLGDADASDRFDNGERPETSHHAVDLELQQDSITIDQPLPSVTTPLNPTVKMTTSVSRTHSTDVFPTKAERSSPISHLTGSKPPQHSDTPPTNQSTQSSSMSEFARAQMKRNQAVEAARARQQADLERNEAEATALRQVSMAGDRVYVPLSELLANTTVNIMGVIVDHPTPPAPPRYAGRDWLCSIVLGDPSSHVGGPGSEGVVVTIMRPTEAELPKLHMGQAVLFERLKISVWNDKLKGNAYSKDNGLGIAAWGVLGTNGNVKTSKDSLHVSRQEVERLESLSRWWRGISGGEGSNVAYVDDRTGQGHPGSPGKRGEVTLSSVADRDFFNATFKIIDAKVGHSPYYELYVTDGTVNPSPTHNFHGVDIGIPPSAIFTLAIFDQKSEPTHSMLTVGNFIYMRNINVKRNRGQGGLELKWSEYLTTEQKEMGWRAKMCTQVSPQDHRATEINRRINELKRQVASGVPPSGDMVSTPTPASRTEARILPVQSRSTEISPAESEPHLAKHVSTTFTDEVACPVLTLGKVRENTFFPNRFRVQARVKSIHPRTSPAANGEPSYVCHFCNDCNRTYSAPANNLCNHCKNINANIELRYRFIVLLEDKDTEMTLLVDGKEAEDFLPPLPPIQYSDNPNDARKQEISLKENREKVDKVLLGAKMDGQRQRPIIDWTMEAYLVPIKGGKGNKGSLAAVRVFGMKGS